MERRHHHSNLHHISETETKRIESAIEVLEEDTKRINLDILREEYFFRDNLDSLWELVDEHASYQNYLLQDLSNLSKYIPEQIIRKYFTRVYQFDKAVNSVDPDYPVLQDFVLPK